MKTRFTFLASISIVLSASAGEILPPDYLIENWSRTMNNAAKQPAPAPPELNGIDYEKVAKQDPRWTRGEIGKLFASIDPEKIKLEPQKPREGNVTMVEPVKVRFTFEEVHTEPNPAAKHAVTTFYRLTGIQRIEQGGVYFQKLKAKLESYKGDKPIPGLGIPLEDPTIQAELLQQFQKDCPGVLADALASTGTVEDPKVKALGEKFPDSMARTPTLKAIGELVAPRGYSIESATCEQFSIVNEGDARKFSGPVFVKLIFKAPSASPATKDGPETAPK